jgi:hypothetical protein
LNEEQPEIAAQIECRIYITLEMKVKQEKLKYELSAGGQRLSGIDERLFGWR